MMYKYFLGNILREPLFDLDEPVKFSSMPSPNIQNAVKLALFSSEPGDKIDLTFNDKDRSRETCTLENYDREENSVKFIEHSQVYRIVDIFRVHDIKRRVKATLA